MPSPLRVSFRNENRNSAGNFNSVSVGPLDFYFSYTTIVAFRAPGYGLVVSENIWSRTTGKHLNWLGGTRIPHEEFQRKLTEVRERFGVVDQCLLLPGA